ncbi:hypothetical protein RF679_04685 [Undibacterium cyanobacteriorum]|uniref:Anti sigma-E protein RseA N-terminal domain-containing protein n=1 Tax=Undibacterium cyanobacteriorum TaxID=3073561 RepID=A0ABY9RMD6_9BURK|nr:hypothetical protein [Undibacterium sp. 20NA77.5]WMW81582.1 hypothetical protein RF679_04685 [Undibacterium sp. 20NA77.5]
MTKLTHDDQQIDPLIASSDPLSAALKDLPQPAPSADLDAAILAKIEAELEQEAIAKAQHSISKGVGETAVAVTTKPERKESLIQAWAMKFKQYWFFPVGAMAVLLASVGLQQVPSPMGTPSDAHPPVNMQIAKAEVKEDHSTSDQEADQARRDARQSSETSTKTPQEMTPQRQIVVRAQTELGRAKIASKSASISEAPIGILANNKIPATPPVAAAPPIEVKSDASSVIVHASRTRAAESVTTTETDQLSAVPQRVQITGSALRRADVESSQAALSLSKKQTEEAQVIYTIPKTELYVHKELMAATEPKPTSAPITQDAQEKLSISTNTMPAPPVPPQAMVAPMPVEPAKPIMAMVTTKDGAERQIMIDTIEEQLRKGNKRAAIQIWKQEREKNPSLELPSPLFDKLKEVERELSSGPKPKSKN